jgi:lambda family phage portal protein
MLNAIDRAVNWLAPVAGARRVQARLQLAAATASGYVGGRRDRASMKEWSALAGASADFDTLPDLDLLRTRSRDLVRNDPLAQSAIATKVAHVIGSGHVVRPEIDADRLRISPEEALAWEEMALDIWTDWAQSRDCDVTRSQTFAELEDLVYRSRLLSGDVLVLRRFKPRPGRLLASAVQVIEADRLSNPDWQMDCDTLAGGIEKDADGAAVAYHVASRHAMDVGARTGTSWQRVAAYDAAGRPLVLHIHGAVGRPEMSRFAPMLAPVIEALKQRSRYTEAELMAAVVSACFAIGMKSPDGDLGGPLGGVGEGAGAASGDPRNKAIALTEPGLIFDLMPDEEIQSFVPGRPNPQFAPFIDAVAREVGAGTDLPAELLLKQFNASYSASRAAMEMAWLFFRTDRVLHVSQFCKPLYEDVIGEAVARGLLKAPGFFTDPIRRQAWLGAVWMGPARPTIDPTKDATADAAYLEMGATDLTRIAAERFGMDLRVVQRRRARDGSDAYTAAKLAGAQGGQAKDGKTDGIATNGGDTTDGEAN